MNKTMRVIAVCVLTAGLTACGSRPVMENVAMQEQNIPNVREDFAQRLAQKIEFTASAVFGYKWIKMSSLGVFAADELKQTFNLIGFNPAGMKIADVQFKNGKVTGDFLFKDFARGVDIPAVIAKDVKRVYFARIPSGSAKMRQEKHKVIFSEQFDDGMMDYTFTGPENNMVKKRFFRDNKLIWQVDYHDYAPYGDKIYPRKIILRNFRYQYKITVNVKEVK